MYEWLKPYQYQPGKSGNPGGRPKGLSIKDSVRLYLEEHPDEKAKFVGHFVHKNRELGWQMLEGSPNAKTESTVDASLVIKTINYGSNDTP